MGRDALMFYEQLMGVGSWDWTLHEGTPKKILRKLRYEAVTPPRLGWFGHVIVTPVWVPADSLSTAGLLAQSIYTGVYVGRSNTGLKMRGFGLPYWMGTANGYTDVAEATAGFTKTVDDWVDDHVLTGTGNTLNGITKGAVSASATTYARNVNKGDTRGLILNGVVEHASMEWRLNHDFSLDVDTVANLFTSGELVLDAESGGRDNNINGLYAVIGDTTDVEQYATHAIVEADDGAPYGWTSAPPFYDVQGNAIVRERYERESQVAAAAALTVAARRLIKYYDPIGRPVLNVSIPDAYELRRVVQPGDYVLVNHPDLEYFDTTHETQYRGDTIFPLSLRVFGMRSANRDGFGYYFRDSDAAGTVTDMTEYVEAETGAATLEVGAVRRTLRVL